MASPIYLSMIPPCFVDRRRHDRKIAVHHLHEALRRHLFAHADEAFDVAEQHGHDTALALGRERRPADQPFDDARIDIAPEGLADALFQPQLFDHAVEGHRQMADLVLRGDGERAIELAAFDRLRAFQQVANRSGQAGADDDREDKPERGRKRRQNDGRDHHCLLPAACVTSPPSRSSPERPSRLVPHRAHD